MEILSKEEHGKVSYFQGFESYKEIETGKKSFTIHRAVDSCMETFRCMDFIEISSPSDKKLQSQITLCDLTSAQNTNI